MTDSTRPDDAAIETVEPAVPVQRSVIPPPPVPERKPSFWSRLFSSRKKQQALAVQNGYLEMLDLIRTIRAHLDRQETVQTTVLSLLEKVPDAMQQQSDVMSLFRQQLQNNLAHDQQLSDGISRLNDTLASMDSSQKSSARTVSDLINRSRESEQLLREVMRRSERRTAALLLVFAVLLGAAAFFFLREQRRLRTPPPPPAIEAPAAVVEPAPAAEPAPAPAPAAEAPAPEPMANPVAEPPAPDPAPEAPAVAEPADAPAEPPPPPAPKKSRKSKTTKKSAKNAPAEPAPAESPAEPPASADVPESIELTEQALSTAPAEAPAP